MILYVDHHLVSASWQPHDCFLMEEFGNCIKFKNTRALAILSWKRNYLWLVPLWGTNYPSILSFDKYAIPHMHTTHFTHSPLNEHLNNQIPTTFNQALVNFLNISFWDQHFFSLHWAKDPLAQNCLIILTQVCLTFNGSGKLSLVTVSFLSPPDMFEGISNSISSHWMGVKECLLQVFQQNLNLCFPCFCLLLCSLPASSTEMHLRVFFIPRVCYGLGNYQHRDCGWMRSE